MIRPDNKIDVALQVQGYQSIEPNAEKVGWTKSQQRFYCWLIIHEDIKTVLKMSKKPLKKL
jgi:hypothetical protein